MEINQHIQRLHEEINNFCDYIQPTPTERKIRSQLIVRIKKIILDLLPDATVEVIGSYVTGFYLPTSNIDLAVLGCFQESPMQKIEYKILDLGIADDHRIISKKYVIKFVDKQTELKVAVYFEAELGVTSTKLVCRLYDVFPVLPKLVYVLKSFLKYQELANLKQGGCATYTLILMCTSFLQLHPSSDVPYNRHLNMGVLLIEFLDLYGRNFDYTNTGIVIKNSGAHRNKESLLISITDELNISILCIENPVMESHNAADSFFGTMQAKKKFGEAYSILTDAVKENPFNEERNDVPILDRIFKVSDDMIKYRKWVQLKFGNNIPVMALSQQNRANSKKMSKHNMKTNPTSLKKVENRYDTPREKL